MDNATSHSDSEQKRYYKHNEHENKLTREQKSAVGLLSIGTFLEYFDLMLYVHMAVLLNELFFPKTDPHTAALISAFGFCSTYILRPFGAMLFGYIGDTIGRKHTVVITTMMMAISCLTMAVLPTYAKIGIVATWVVTICRIIQGLSSMGEIIGAEIYLTETIKGKNQSSSVSFTSSFSRVGSFFALLVASICTNDAFKEYEAWRVAFLFGALIALAGTVARATLRETPEFADATRRIKGSSSSLLEAQKINKKTAIAYFMVECSHPVLFYLTFIHCGNVLKSKFGYTAQQVIQNNLNVSFICMIICFFLVYLVRILQPFFVLKIKLLITCICCFFFIMMDRFITNPFELMILQTITISFEIGNFPAAPLFFKRFPVMKRFRSTAMIYALTRAFIHVISSFGLVYLLKYFGNYGVGFILIPTVVFYTIGFNHFLKLEDLDNRALGKSPSIYNL